MSVHHVQLFSRWKNLGRILHMKESTSRSGWYLSFRHIQQPCVSASRHERTMQEFVPVAEVGAVPHFGAISPVLLSCALV